MDKNTILGLVLIAAILIGFGVYNSNQNDKYQETRAKEQIQRDSIAQIENLRLQEEAAKHASNTTPADTTTSVLAEGADSLATYAPTYYLRDLDIAAAQDEEFYTLENELLKLTISNKGGRVYAAELKEYSAYGGSPLLLLNGEANIFAIDFYTNQALSTDMFAFTPENSIKHVTVSESDTLKNLTLRLSVDSLSYIEYTYSMRPNNYMVDLNVSMVGMDKHIPKRVTSVDLRWLQNAPQQEKGYKNENNNTLLAYRYPDSSVEELSGTSETDSESVKSKVQWVAFKQQFFSSILLCNESFLSADLSSTTYPEGNSDHLVKQFSATMSLPYNSNSAVQSYSLNFYFGPNGYRMLKSYDQDFEKLVPLGGWAFAWVNRWIIIPVFDFLNKFISNFGLIIFLLTILIKLVLFPLTRKSYISSAKMRVLKPEIDKINAKYPKKEDAMKKQQETMALYKRTGVSMMGGCLPMLLQLPFLIAMFRFFPASIELRQESFLWADDLSSYDSILNLPFNIPFYGDHVSLFALLMAITMFITSKMNMAQQSSAQQMPGMKFMMLYMMPIIMLCMFNNLSSALNYYFFLSNLITLIQTWVIRKWVVKDHELLAKMNARAAQQQPAKKSKFQQRLEDMQKQQQQIQKQRQQNQRKK